MFLRGVRAEEYDGDRSPFGQFWFSPVPFRSGGPMTSEAALRLTAVYRCISLIADQFSLLPFRLYERKSDGGRAQVTDHWLYRLMARRPNEFQNPVTFRKLMQAWLELRGNAYSQIITNRQGEITDLIPLHPDRLKLEMIAENNWRYRYQLRDQSERILPRADVLHLRGVTLDGIQGVSPIRAAREAITTGIAAQEYGMNFFQNDGRPSGWIEFPGSFKTDEQKKLFRDAFQKTQTGSNRGKTAVLDRGMKFHELAISNDDAQFIETRKFTVSEIARLFGVPPHKIGDLEKATFSNIEQQALEFVTDCLLPRLVNWEVALAYEFLGDDENLEIEFQTTALLRGDSGARSKFYHAGITDGWLTRNEARIDDGRNPLPGLDEPLRPLNMVEESAAEDLEEGDGAEVPQEPKPDRLGALASAAAERIARKEVEFVSKALKADEPAAALASAYEKHAAFVADALGVSREAARNYCDEQRERACGEGFASMPREDFAITTRRRLVSLAAHPLRESTR